MSRPTVYLAGPVAAYDDGGAGWREDVIKLFSDEYQFRNPLDKYNVPLDELEIVPQRANRKGTVGVKTLVEGDKQLLQESDAVLVGYTDVQSIGTPMEVMWARERDYPVALWIRDETGFADLSPWYRYHATATTKDLTRALEYLAKQAGDADE